MSTENSSHNSNHVLNKNDKSIDLEKPSTNFDPGGSSGLKESSWYKNLQNQKLAQFKPDQEINLDLLQGKKTAKKSGCKRKAVESEIQLAKPGRDAKAKLQKAGFFKNM